ncbi:MAG: LysE family transporter [Chloroflexi bacterium]|nr:LysE family transporter [Chloroflexota bacterium]
MDSTFLLRGLIIGFSIAAPVGPIGLLCIRRTLADGRAAGFVSGLGAATADAIYGSIAGFGLTFISNALIAQEGGLRLAGGAFLVYLGVRTFLAKPAERAAAAAGSGLAGAYASTFILTLTNPLTMLSFAAIFAGLGVVGAADNTGAAGLLVLGVFLGSALWWLILSSGANMVRARLSTEMLRWVNRASGAAITTAGVIALLSIW